MTMRAERRHVAIGGRMQVGKTTCALRLVERHGYELRPLAQPIKEIAARCFGWNGRKDARGRRLLQGVGSVGRSYDPEIWLRAFERWMAERRDDRPVVVDDLRLLAEARRLRELGFLIALVRRPTGAGSEDAADLERHETETELEGIEADVVVVNDGTLDDLAATVDRVLTRVPAADAAPEERRLR